MSEPDRPTFADYDTESFYDEIFDAEGEARPGARLLVERINSVGPGELRQRQESIERALLRMGITFAVYGDRH